MLNLVVTSCGNWITSIQQLNEVVLHNEILMPESPVKVFQFSRKFYFTWTMSFKRLFMERFFRVRVLKSTKLTFENETCSFFNEAKLFSNIFNFFANRIWAFKFQVELYIFFQLSGGHWLLCHVVRPMQDDCSPGNF